MTPDPNPPLAGDTSTLSSAQRLCVVLLLALFTAMSLIGLQHKGWTYDEEDHMRYGINITHGDSTRFDDSKMPVSAWNALPGRIADAVAPGALSEQWGRFAARVPTVIAALLLGLLIFQWARELYGPRAGLFALALFVLEPNLLAHSRWATTDLYAALGTTLALYCYWRFMRDGGLRAGCGSALALGFAQITKYSGVFLLPVFVLLALIRHWRTLLGRDGTTGAWWSRWQPRRSLGYAALMLAGILLVINAGFLFEKSFTLLGDYTFRSAFFQNIQHSLPAWLPIPVPYPYVEGLDWVKEREVLGSIFGNLYFFGELREGRGFTGYYFAAYLFKVPLAIQLLFVAALVMFWRQRRSFRFSRDEAFLLVPIAFFFWYFNFPYQSPTGIRFLMVAFPMMHIFTASLLAPQVSPSKTAQRGIGVLLVASAVSVLSWHPHYLSYFNELVPDRKMAYRILSDSNIDWGENAYYLDRWMEKNPDAIFEPGGPASGTIVATVNEFTGIFSAERYAWLRDGIKAKPVGHIAYSYLIFEVTPEQVNNLPDEYWPKSDAEPAPDSAPDQPTP